MKYIRKSISIFAVLALVFILSFGNVSAGTIYESKTKETVTSGVTLETITRFTDDGWQKINVLRVDLENPNVKVDTLIDSESIKKLTNVKNLAQSAGAVAAVNAGFFNWLKGESGKGYPDGPVIKSGEFLSVDSEYNRYNNSMATIAIDKDNNVYFDFWKTDITLHAPDGSTTRVFQYNKPSPFQYTDITIWTSAWDKYSLGVSQQYPDLVEVVVDNGTVVEIRQGLPAVEIPQNGYVIISRGANAQFLLQHFKVGDPVEISFSTVLDWQKIEMAVTGSAILVKDGQIPEKFSYEISGVHPRTAAIEARRREIFYLNINWFMATLLDRKDRMSMASGLEVRVPFCDHRLVQYVWNIPWELKMYNKREKGLLRQALKGILPDDIIERKKSPYPKTHNPSYKKAVSKWLLEILNDSSSPLHQLIDVKVVRSMAEGNSDNTDPWFGQLMAQPQMLAYLIQVDFWLRDNHISIV